MRAAILALVLCACSRSTSNAPPPASEPPPVAVEARALESAYAEDHAAADAKYGDRTLAISGVVTAVQDAYDGRVHVAIGGADFFEAGGDVPDPGVDAPMGPGGATAAPLAAKAHALRPGARATVTCKAGTGRSTEALGQTAWSPTLYDCWL